MAFIRRAPRDTSEPIINITPLIDVVFVILIAFIIIAPLLERDQIKLAPSGIHREQVSENSSLQIHVHEDNTIVLNNIPIAESELVSQLVTSRQQHPHTRPQVFHDKKAQFGTYQTLKNALEQAGFEEIDIILSPS